MTNNKQQNTESKCTCIEHDPYCCQIHGNCPVCVKPENPEDVVLGHKTSLVAQTLDSKENKQQTAVEWQFEQLFNSFEKFNNDEYTFDEYLKRNLEIRAQSKEMEKQQIIDAYHTNPLEAKWKNIGVNYYNETYGGCEQ